MTDLIQLTQLEEALNPIPRDFENIAVSKTYEKRVNGKIHVGFISYVIVESEDESDVLRDEGYCIFTDGADQQDDCISQKEEVISIDDPRVPLGVRNKWIELKADEYKAYNLIDLESSLNEEGRSVGRTLKKIIMNRIEKLRK